MTLTKEKLNIHQDLKICFGILDSFCYLKCQLDFQWKNDLKMIRIYFDTPIFDRINKDRAAKFVDILSAIGGTMGLLTGFSIISAVEIIYFAVKFLLNCMRLNAKQ